MASASHEFRGSVDFNQFELRNATFQNLMTPPVGPVQGQIYFDSRLSLRSPFYWDSSEWVPFGLNPIHKRYDNEVDMLANQAYQIKNYIYYRTDEDIYYEKLPSNTGALSDYNPIGGLGSIPTVDVLGTVLTGYTVGANSILINTDTVLGAFQKVQGQINARVSGTIASGRVAFGTGVNTIGGDSELIWDNVNKRLSIGTPSTLGYKLSIQGNIVLKDLNHELWLGNSLVRIKRANNSLTFDAYNGFNWFDSFSSSIRMSLLNSGHLGILTTSPTNTLDVNGTVRIRTISNGVGDFLTKSATGVITSRTAAEALGDIGAEPSFVKGSIIQGAGMSVTGTLTSRLVGTGDITIAHLDTSTQATVTNTNGTILQSATLDTYGHVTALASLDGDLRWLRQIEVLNNQSVWSHVALTSGIDITQYTTGSANYPTSLGLSVAFYAATSDSTSGFGRAFGMTRGYNTRNYYIGSPNTSGVHNGWDLIYTSFNLNLTTLGGEPEFTKGNVVQGDGIALTGTLTSRLVGSGNITIDHADTSTFSKTSLTGANVISNLTVDTYGHVTDWTTRALAAGDIGAEVAFTKGSFIAGTNVTLGGTIANRLVGTGDITINATVPAGSVPVTQIFTYVATSTFTLSFSSPTPIWVTLNGQVIQEGGLYDYTISGTTLSVTAPLTAGDEIAIKYYTSLTSVINYSRNIDGGAPDSVYLAIQNVDGGTP